MVEWVKPPVWMLRVYLAKREEYGPGNTEDRGARPPTVSWEENRGNWMSVTV